MRIGVILAGGRGERMGAGRNKVLLELAGEPLLAHALRTFRACCVRLLVVSAAEDMDAVRALAGDVPVVPGGATRHGSEWNALQALRDSLAADDVVAIHDAARPLVAAADVTAVFEAAEAHGAAMLAVPADLPAVEVRDGTVTQAYEAGRLWRAQTPQAAKAALLLEAYARADKEGFTGTDTAAVLERCGCPVWLVQATAENPKVTVPADLPAAEELLRRRLHP